MFNGLFIEGTSQQATLPKHNPVAFGIFIGWIYKGVIETPNLSTWLKTIPIFFRREKSIASQSSQM
jgi:hypothetical protein